MIDINDDGSPQVTLIDFGLADKFVFDGTKDHIAESSSVDTFRGNLYFSSLRQMNFLRTSRKDDFIALFYLLTTLLNDNTIIVD